MADRATGPVKPPVIDLTARSAPRAEGDGKPDPAPETARATDPFPGFREAFAGADWRLLGSAALGGAVLGTILTYVMATLLPLPARLPPMPPDLSADVAAQGGQIATLGDRLAALEQTAKKTQVSLDATIAQLDSGLAAADKSIADVKAAIPPAAAPVDLGPLEAQLRTLKSQVDAIAAGASGADAGAIAQSLDAVQGSLQSLTTRLNGVDQTVAALRTDLDAARKALSDHIAAAAPTEAGTAMKLPLILSGLESAFAAGKPFQPELDALRAVLPDLRVPPELAAAAPNGLSRPDALMAAFEQKLPEILAARDIDSTDWTQNALDWAKSLLALRPAEEQQGDTPDAIVSRLEGAMSRRDYAGASALVAQLPAPMQKAAQPVAADIAAHAAADTLVGDVRTRALSTGAAK